MSDTREVFITFFDAARIGFVNDEGEVSLSPASELHKLLEDLHNDISWFEQQAPGHTVIVFSSENSITSNLYKIRAFLDKKKIKYWLWG